MKYLLLLLLLLTACADECNERTVEELAFQADRVVAAIVIAKGDSLDGGFRIDIEECFIGSCRDSVVLYNEGPFSSSTDYSIGETYLFFTRNDTVRACSGTNLYSSFTSEEIHRLRLEGRTIH